MSDRDKIVSEIMAVEERVVPYLPELLRGLWELGSWPHEIAQLLEPLNLPDTTRVIDLGCGKGATSILVARELGLFCHGVDLMEDFIREAREHAAIHGVADRCEFLVGDMCDTVKSGEKFDVVVLASIGGIFGGWADTIGQLRGIVRPGGYIVIDDGFAREGEPLGRPGYGHYRGQGETVRQLTSHGDTVIAERIYGKSDLENMNRRNTEIIRENIERLKQTDPEASPLLMEYLRHEEEECDYLEEHFAPAVWLIRRGVG